VTLARQVLAKYANQAETTEEGINFTSYNMVDRYKEALEKYGPVLQKAGVDPKWVGGYGLPGVLAFENAKL